LKFDKINVSILVTMKLLVSKLNPKEFEIKLIHVNLV